jgi:hypothetical protein
MSNDQFSNSRGSEGKTKRPSQSTGTRHKRRGIPQARLSFLSEAGHIQLPFVDGTIIIR